MDGKQLHKITSGGVFLPSVAERNSIDLSTLILLMTTHWHRYKHPGFIDNYFYDNLPQREMFYEVCDSKYERGKSVRRENIQDWMFKNTGKDKHISVYTHDRTWLKEVNESGKVRSVKGKYVGADWLWIELDRKADGGINKAVADAQKILARIGTTNGVTTFFSGNASVHICIDTNLFAFGYGTPDRICGRGNAFWNLAHHLANGCRYEGVKDIYNEPEPEKVYYKVKGKWPDSDNFLQEIESIDPNIYNINSLIRSPFSTHEKSGGKKYAYTQWPKLLWPNKIQRIQPSPLLIYEYLINFTPIKKPYKTLDINIKNDYILRELLDSFSFDPDDEYDGWVSDIENTFYNDTNPSVSININTGYIHDFGDAHWQIPFVEFIRRKYNLKETEVRNFIKHHEQKLQETGLQR